MEFPQVAAPADDSAPRPGPCGKPPGALYVESGRERVLLALCLCRGAPGLPLDRAPPDSRRGHVCRCRPGQVPVAAGHITSGRPMPTGRRLPSVVLSLAATDRKRPRMRRLTYFIGCSVDGFIAGPDGQHDSTGFDGDLK